MKDGKQKIALVCSHGGHLTEMQYMMEAFQGHDLFFVTYDSVRTQKLFQRKYLIEAIGTNWVRMAIAFVKFFQIFLKERPDIVVSTGSEIAIPAFYLAKIFRARTIFIECWCRVRTTSATGRLVYPVVDTFLVQWPQLVAYVRAQSPVPGCFTMSTDQSKDGLMDFEKFPENSGIKLWLRRQLFIDPIVRQFRGYVLDIGCGPGVYLERYKGKSFGVDAHPNNVRICKKKGINAEVNDANTFTKENSFDTGPLSHLLEHLDDPEQVIENAFKSVRPCGRIIIIVPCREGFESGLTPEVGHKKFVSEDDVAAWMKKLGCKKISSQNFPPMLGGKFKELRMIYEKTDSGGA